MLLNRSCVSALGLVVAVSLTAAPVAFGGTFFRLEIGPAIAGNVPTTKTGLFVVRALACDEARDVRMTAIAEGIVDGARQSWPLKLIALDAPAAYAVVRQWPAGGVWVVNLTGTCPGRKATAAAVVPIGKAGFRRESSQLLERAATATEIETALNALPRGGE